MVLSGQRLLLGLIVVIGAVLGILRLWPDSYWLALVTGGCGVLGVLAASMIQPPAMLTRREPDDIDGVSPARRRELIRGTGLALREMHYRYSIRPDPAETGERRCFTAEVNAVRIGFVPVVITDNSTDRQGYGYVAFVYDGRRWRGPGLPCPAGQPKALEHAARCVTPLEKDETDQT